MTSITVSPILTTGALADLIYNGVQGLCTYKADASPRFFSWLESKQLPFFFADAASLLWTGGVALVRIGILIKPLMVTGGAVFLAGTCGILGVGGLAVVAYGITLVIDKIFQGIANNNEQTERKESEKIKQTLYVMRIIVNIALTILCPNPFYVASAIIEGYSLLTFSQPKRIHVSKTVNVQFYDNQGTMKLADKIQSSYSFLRTDQKFLTDDKCCAICLSETTPTTAAGFCSKHPLHLECVVTEIEHQLKVLSQNAKIKNRVVKVGLYTYVKGQLKYVAGGPEYELTAPLWAAPSCPTCLKPLPLGLSMKIHDVTYNQWTTPKIEWTAATPQS